MEERRLVSAAIGQKLNEQTTHIKELCEHMIKYFLSKDNNGLYALVNGSHVIPHLRLLAANLELHFSQQIISQIDISEFLIMDFPHDFREFGKFSYRHSEFEAA